MKLDVDMDRLTNHLKQSTGSGINMPTITTTAGSVLTNPNDYYTTDGTGINTFGNGWDTFKIKDEPFKGYKNFTVEVCENGFIIKTDAPAKTFIFDTLERMNDWIKENIAPTGEGQEFLDNV